MTRSEWDNAGVAERAMKIPLGAKPGRGRGLEIVEYKRRLLRSEAAAPVDRTTTIDRAIVAAIFCAGEGFSE